MTCESKNRIERERQMQFAVAIGASDGWAVAGLRLAVITFQLGAISCETLSYLTSQDVSPEGRFRDDFRRLKFDCGPRFRGGAQ